MYNDYMQNLFKANYSPYNNTYESSIVKSNNLDSNQNFYDYGFNFNYQIPTNYTNLNHSLSNLVTETENLYPEIYKIIYPMIKKICSKNTSPITKDIINEMTDEIYNNIESDNASNLNISVEGTKKSENKSFSNSSNSRITNSEKNDTDSQKYNPIHDLIKIHLIREIIENFKFEFSPKPRPFVPIPFPPPNSNIQRYQTSSVRPRF